MEYTKTTPPTAVAAKLVPLPTVTVVAEATRKDAPKELPAVNGAATAPTPTVDARATATLLLNFLIF